MTQEKRVMNAAVIIMPAMLISRVTGFLREILLPAKMGPEFNDAYQAAFLLPDLMYSLLLGGAVAAAIIPILSGHISNDDEEGGWRATGTFINIVVIAMAVFCFLGMIFTRPIIEVIAAGYGKDLGKLNLTIELARILFPSVAFLMLAGICNGVLNAYHKFVIAAYGPTLYNVLCIVSIAAFADANEKAVKATAYGVMISSILYFVFQFVFSIKQFRYYKPKFFWQEDASRKLFLLAIPALVSSTIVQANVMISRIFSISLEAEGRLTALNMADKIWQMPLGVFAQSIGVAMLPTLSAYYASDKPKEYGKTLFNSIRTVLVLSIPSAFGLIALSSQVTGTLFLFGKVREEDVFYASAALMIYSVALIYQSMVYLMNRAFYSIQDTRTPMITGIIAIVVNFTLNMIFIRYTSLDVVGMALAFVIAVVINCFMQVIWFGRSIRVNIIRVLSPFLYKTFFASVLMGVILYLIKDLLVLDFSSKVLSTLVQMIILGIKILVGILVFVATSVFLRNDSVIKMLQLVIKKIRRD